MRLAHRLSRPATARTGRLAAPSPAASPAAATACPRVRLALHDGTERTYLLHDPRTCPRDIDRHTAAYDQRVHLAYVLAQQGHDARWLADFADLPLPAAQRITEAAAHP